MMKLALTNRRFNFSALLALGALLYLCIALGSYSDASSKASTKNRLSGPHKSETESSSSPPRGSAKSVVVKAQVSIGGMARAQHSPTHPAPNLPPELFTGLSLSSTYSPPNDLADVRSLIWLFRNSRGSPLHLVVF